MTPEELAKLIFEISQRLAFKEAACEAIAWHQVPEPVRQFKIAVATELLTHQGLPWPKISPQTIEEMRNIMNWLEE